MNSSLELKPRNLLDLIDAAVRLYRRHFASLLGISAVMLVPFGVTYVIGQFYTYAALQPMMTGQPGPGFEIDREPLIIGAVFTGLSFVILSVLGPLSQGALALGISECYLGRPATVGGTYRGALKYWWSLFLVGLVFGLLVSLGPLLGALVGAAFGIPVGIFVAPTAGGATAAGGALIGMFAGLPLTFLLFTWFVFYEQTMVLEDLRGLDSLQRSRELVAGHGWHVFGTLMLTGIGIGVATMILTAPLSIAAGVVTVSRPEILPHLNLLSQCMQQVINVLLGPVFMIVQTLLYYDLRIRKEGFDLEMMATALGPDVLVGAPDTEAPSPEEA